MCAGRVACLVLLVVSCALSAVYGARNICVLRVVCARWCATCGVPCVVCSVLRVTRFASCCVLCELQFCSLRAPSRVLRIVVSWCVLHVACSLLRVAGSMFRAASCVLHVAC